MNDSENQKLGEYPTENDPKYELLPADVVEGLVTVAQYVSYGRGYVGVKPYPDSTARFALGALREHRERMAYCELPHASIEEEEECDRAAGL